MQIDMAGLISAQRASNSLAEGVWGPDTPMHLPWEFEWFRNTFSELRSEDKVEEKRFHGDIQGHVQERTVHGALSFL